MIGFRRPRSLTFALLAGLACATPPRADVAVPSSKPPVQKAKAPPGREEELRALIADPGQKISPLEKAAIRARALAELAQILFDRGSVEEANQTLERAQSDARAAGDADMLESLHGPRFRVLSALAMKRAEAHDFRGALKLVDGLALERDLTAEERRTLASQRFVIIDMRGDQKDEAAPVAAEETSSAVERSADVKVNVSLPAMEIDERDLSFLHAIPTEPPSSGVGQVVLPTVARKSEAEVRAMIDKNLALANVPRIDGRPHGARKLAQEKPASKASEPVPEPPVETARIEKAPVEKATVEKTPEEKLDRPAVAAADTPPIDGAAAASERPARANTAALPSDALALREPPVEKAMFPEPSYTASLAGPRFPSSELMLERSRPVELPAIDDVPGSETGRFDARSVQRVVSAQRKSVASCYDRSIRVGEHLDGRLEMQIAVMPTGSVSAADIRSPSFQGTELGRCVSSTIRRWRFPPFEGDTQRVDVPFVFRAPRH